MERKHYGAIDGLYTIACVGIAMMHIVANNSYKISYKDYHSTVIHSQMCRRIEPDMGYEE